MRLRCVTGACSNHLWLRMGRSGSEVKVCLHPFEHRERNDGWLFCWDCGETVPALNGWAWTWTLPDWDADSIVGTYA